MITNIAESGYWSTPTRSPASHPPLNPRLIPSIVIPSYHPAFISLSKSTSHLKHLTAHHPDHLVTAPSRCTRPRPHGACNHARTAHATTPAQRTRQPARPSPNTITQ